MNTSLTATAAARPGSAVRSLQERLDSIGSAVTMLRDSRSGRFKSPYIDEFTNWQDEQAGWTQTATLFDQSHHMTDVYFRGPDIDRLLAEHATNSFATWGPGKTKHLIVCAPDGNIIGTAVLFALDDGQVSVVGPTAAANWLQYQVDRGGYDVEYARDERTNDLAPGTRRRTFRYEIEGPAVRAILEKANGGSIGEVRFFSRARFTLGGVPVDALSHTMVGVPGSESMGMEIWGPIDEAKRVWDALLEAGEEFGLVRGGGLAYYTGSVEAGYAAQPTPAIYSAPELRGYREWLPARGYEGGLSVGGSFASENIEDYYVTPFDFGYGHLVKFDHDFVGRTALEAAAGRPHPKKVWLRWNRDDVARVYAGALYGGSGRYKYLATPLGRYARVHLDAVLDGERPVGTSTLCGYTVNVGDWMSVAFVAEQDAVDGKELRLVWGEENGGTSKLNVESHVQTDIRVTVSNTPLERQ
jgi:vanillate/3-O-methylgallate O-demethylase